MYFSHVFTRDHLTFGGSLANISSEPERIQDREDIEECIRLFQHSGEKSITTRAGIWNTVKGILAKSDMSDKSVTVSDFEEGMEQAGRFWNAYGRRVNLT